MSRTQTISKAWSDLHPGLWVRLVTPSVVRSGEILAIRKRSMNIRWLDIGERALPDAKHYFAAWKMRLWADPENPGPMPQYYLELLPDKPGGTRPWKEIKEKARQSSRQWPEEELLDVNDVCAIVSLDPKSVRRRLRSGSLPGTQEGSRWRVRRQDALDLAKKLGR